MKRIAQLMILGGMVTLTACQPNDLNNELQNMDPADAAMVRALEFGALPQTAPAPANNPTTSEKVRLGEILFFDPILSGEKDVSCATCHHPELGFADARELPIGVGGRGLGPERFDAINDDIGIVPRNSPSVLNTAFNGMQTDGSIDPESAPMFWDNRAQSLEAQATGPMESFIEMRGHAYAVEVALDSVVNRLAAIGEYRNLFRQAFPGRGPIDITQVSHAISAYERTIIAPNSPFDRFARGDENALSNRQKEGLLAFVEAGCNACHNGPMFSDFDLHTIGVPDNNQLDFSDSGINGDYAFRTPTLRNLNFTGPFFHNGTSGDLRDVMGHYLRAQRAARDDRPQELNPNIQELDPLLAEQRLQRDQVDEIIAFLDGLNDPDFNRDVPNRVPSGLPVGGL